MSYEETIKGLSERCSTLKDNILTEEVVILEEIEETSIIVDDKDTIITTAEEMEAFYIIKSILRGDIPANRIGYKDTLSYFGILIDEKVTKWICRVFLKDSIKYIIIPDETGTAQKHVVEVLDDIYRLKDILIKRASSLL